MLARMASGKLPDCGAIFMSNGRTRRECLERELFGLPHQFIDFVKNIKAGMILFLFEHERRELYGVFEAISDGGVDIVPHAYRDSGRAYPAQVQIRALMRCDPLSESCFRDAIRENYYAKYKFNFGLSREQVHRLLLLFSERRVGDQKIVKQKKVKRRRSRSHDKESLSIDTGRHVVAKKLKGKSQSPNTKVSDHKSRNTSSPESEENEPPDEIKQIDIPASPFSDLGDYIPLSSPEHTANEGELDQKTLLTGLHSGISDSKASDQKSGKTSSPGSEEKEPPEKIKPIDIPVSPFSDLGDYIPLSSPEHSENEDELNLKPLLRGLHHSGILDPKASDQKSGKTSSPRTEQKEIQEEIEQADVPESHSLDLGNYIHLSSPENSACGGLHSDIPEQRASAFSRLKLPLKAATQREKEDESRNVETTESVEKIMQDLLLRRANWAKKMRKEGETESSENADSSSVCKKSSVFSRLSFTSTS